jgi:hypothetical protein
VAITNFIPEIWSAQILVNLRDQLRYGQAGVVNRNYEGAIAVAGDTVHITNFTDPSVRDYARNSTTVTYDGLTDDDTTLVVNQAQYFGFKVDDLDRRQALPGFVEEVTIGATYNLVAAADAYLAGQMVGGVDADNVLDAASITDPADAYELLVDFRTVLAKTNTPGDGRFVIVPPEFYALLLKDDRFIRADAAGTTAGLRNGQVGAAAGFTVIESNTVPEDDGEFSIVAGHSIATTYAQQIVNVEALRLETAFADGVRGLHLYGTKVVRPKNLALCGVTVPAVGSA